MKYLFLSLLLIIPYLLISQTLIDDFENGLNDWEFWYLGSNEQPIVWQSEFSDSDAIVALCYTDYHDGNASLLLSPFGFGYITAIKDVSCHYGTYWLYFKITPNEPISSDAFFSFMVEDLFNHYSIHMCPNNSDNPQLSISKRVDNEITFLEQNFNINFNYNAWYKLVVGIDANGVINAQILNLEGQIIDEVAAIDTEIELKGKIGVKCFSNTSYFDDINYTSYTGIQFHEKFNNTISLFPNPASDIIYLSNCPSDCEYTIADINGRIIKQGNLKENSINVQSIDNGIYFISIGDINKSTIRFSKE